MAVSTERRLTGVRRGEFTAQELHGKHLAYWDEQRIQEFWSGQSFQRTDDGNLLSYELARILVEEMSRDWTCFAAFVRQARREHAGADAAARLLAMDLGASVSALFDRPDGAAWAPATSAS